jgi:hypothetical protein
VVTLVADVFISGVPDELVVAGLMLGGLLAAVPGWLAWTGRYRGWGRRGGLIDPWMPLLLFMGVGWILMFASFLMAALAGSDEPPAVTAIGAILLLLGLALIFWGMIGSIVTMGPADTYRKKPNGTWVTRLFLPRWYHEYLRDTFGGRPRV